MPRQRLDLVGMTEISQMLGMRRKTVVIWRLRGRLPAPATELAMGPVWHRRDIEKWAATELAKRPA